MVKQPCGIKTRCKWETTAKKQEINTRRDEENQNPSPKSNEPKARKKKKNRYPNLRRNVGERLTQICAVPVSVMTDAFHILYT